MLREIADRRAVKAAVGDWRRKFSHGARIFPGLSGDIYWHEAPGVWGRFTRYRKTSGEKYWNVFGRLPFRFRSNIVVEVNPPLSSTYRNVVGLVARDDDGKRWMLHRGHLHMSGFNIDAERFRRSVRLASEPVVLSTGDVAPYEYYRVADLDDWPEVVVLQTARFVDECARLRTMYANRSERTSHTPKSGRAKLSPELTGGYSLPAQEERDAYRWHADVWAALADRIDARGVAHSNGRVGRFGPDLKTPAHLFEIKSDTAASSVQQGIGQLLLYEALLGRRFRKVLVLPAPLPAFSGVLNKLKIEVLTYTRKGRSVSFSERELAGLLSRT